MRSFLIAMLVVLCACSDDGSASDDGGGTAGDAGVGGSGAGAGGSGGSGGPGGSGAAGGTGGTGGTSGAGGGPACTTLSDDFDDAASLGCWTLFHQTESVPARHDRLEIVGGDLIIEPLAGGWFQDDRGPFVFKEISGDFVVEVNAAALDESDDTLPPTGDYHSAGLVVRDPASVVGDENWIMYNVGHQNDQGATTGTEGKTTVDSVSTLDIEQGTHRGLLRVCRIGSDFRLFRQLDGEGDWTEEHQFTRGDLPTALQVGLVANAWPPAQPSDARNMQGRLGHFHVGVPASVADCTASIDPQ